MTGKEIVAEWECRQTEGLYKSYKQSMSDLAAMIDAKDTPIVVNTTIDSYDSSYDERWDYRNEQAKLRAAGFDAYNCDLVDEFPRW